MEQKQHDHFVQRLEQEHMSAKADGNEAEEDDEDEMDQEEDDVNIKKGYNILSHNSDRDIRLHHLGLN